MLREIKCSTDHGFLDEFNRLQGEYKSWHYNGNLRIHCFYINDRRHGECREWHWNGRLSDHYNTVNGYRHGEYKRWFENGQLREHKFFVNGKEVFFNELSYPLTEEDRMYIKLKYNLPLISDATAETDAIISS